LGNAQRNTRGINKAKNEEKNWRKEKMKILYPNIIVCKRMNKLLGEFYDENKNKRMITNYTKFYHVIAIFCSYYNITKPNYRFRRNFGHEKCVGTCSESGCIQILYPYNYLGNKIQWMGIVYHELFHHYLYNRESSALEFELNMLRRR
jgi:hypothetical protein